MARKRVRMTPWAKHPDHGWKKVHKTRQDPDGDVIEEVAFGRGAAAAFFLAWAACACGWWWQTQLDSWPRRLVIAAAVVVTIYLVVITAWLVLARVVGRYIRNV